MHFFSVNLVGPYLLAILIHLQTTSTCSSVRRLATSARSAVLVIV